MTSEPLPPEVWVEEGRRVAAGLDDVAAAVVTGRDPDAAAAVALGIARAVPRERRVAVADLVGQLRLLTPLDDQAGLLECLRDGEPVSAIGEPLPTAPNVYVLPSGRGPIAERWVFESARWERLVAGFREVDALLLLVAPAHAPGLEALIRRVDGVVAVDLPPVEVRAWPLLATVDHPEPELPVIAPRATAPTETSELVAGAQPYGGRRAGRRIGRWILLAALLLAGGLYAAQRVGWDLGSAAAPRDAAVPEHEPSPAAAPSDAPLVEVSLGAPVNPSDSAIALRFAVELVAANTLASANSSLSSLEVPAPAATVVPVPIGSSVRPWFHAVVGAWPDRASADVWLTARRTAGTLRPSAGRVVEVPLALVLEDSLGREDVAAAVAQWNARGVQAYGLWQSGGWVRLYAGAFESAGQALWLASVVEEAGVMPRLAYRTGRMF